MISVRMILEEEVAGTQQTFGDFARPFDLSLATGQCTLFLVTTLPVVLFYWFRNCRLPVSAFVMSLRACEWKWDFGHQLQLQGETSIESKLSELLRSAAFSSLHRSC